MTMHSLQGLRPDLRHRQAARAFEQCQPLRDGMPGGRSTAKRLHVGPSPLHLLWIHPPVGTQRFQDEVGGRMLKGDKQHRCLAGYMARELPGKGGFAYPRRASQEMQTFVEAI